MDSSAVKTFLKKALPEADIITDGEGCSLNVIIISNEFEQLSVVKRQKIVYEHLGPLITEGTVHAVSMQTFTPQEWEKKINSEQSH